jgi:manganese transport protein
VTRLQKISSILIWAVISAAFIGPGTLTTAIAAGSLYKLDLAWAVLLSGLACFLLLELAGRISIATQQSLGALLILKFGQGKGKRIALLLGLAVIFGCAAYEAGNIMGAVSGIELLSGIKPAWSTLGVALLAFFVLWTGRRKQIALLMTGLVMLMGLAFCWLAFKNFPSLAQLSAAIRNIHIPIEAHLITVGLIGTTIVPYNLFIGAGISRGQSLFSMRSGLLLSVGLGTLITLSILIAGNVVTHFDNFFDLQNALNFHLGAGAGILLGLGLLAAGFSSSITSPYAAAIVAEDVLRWKQQWQIRMAWGIVLLSGFIFGISGYKPVPVIIAAQAINGLILPLVAVYLIIISNDNELIAKKFRHHISYNLLLLLILFVVLIIGLHNIDKSLAQIFTYEAGNWTAILVVALLIIVFVIWNMLKRRTIRI